MKKIIKYIFDNIGQVMIFNLILMLVVIILATILLIVGIVSLNIFYAIGFIVLIDSALIDLIIFLV
jgi:hypothetical protein